MDVIIPQSGILSSPEAVAAVAEAALNVDFLCLNTSAVAPVVAAFTKYFIFGDHPGLLPGNFYLLQYSMFYSLAGLGYTCLACQ